MCLHEIYALDPVILHLPSGGKVDLLLYPSYPLWKIYTSLETNKMTPIQDWVQGALEEIFYDMLIGAVE